MEKEANNKIVLASLVLGLFFIAGVGIVSKTFYAIKKLDNTLTVTGSAKKQVKSDLVKWYSSFERVVFKDNIKQGYALMKADENAVKEFFKSRGIAESEINISPVMMNEVYKYNDISAQNKEYSFRQTVSVQSKELDKITEIAKNVQSLAEAGLVFSTQSLEYYYTNLPQERVALLSDAIKDAKERAEKIAQSSGRSVGSIKEASMGIVQVMSLNSVDVSDYGSYDTSSIDKEVMVTVRAVFSME